MTQTAVGLREESAQIERSGRKIRVDIQVLRALAVSMVVLYHLWPDRVPGGFVGVDVFFVISGFLITTHLLGSPPQSFRDLATFWAKRIRRLLPATFAVLGATLLSSRVLLPPSLWESVARETMASVLYVQNWYLASSSVDYLAAENAPSPVQHFWSLSVEEQFYIVWPILVLAAGVYAARRSTSFIRTAAKLFFLVFLVSFAASIVMIFVEPEAAYFTTHTRMWELAAGGIVAVVAMRSPLGEPRWPLLCGWVGLALILASAVMLRGDMPFPGWLAVFPVIGTALAIWASSSGKWSFSQLLGKRPVVWVGDVSYSLYLWHWPLIIVLPYVSGGSLGPLDKAAIVLCALFLAAVTKKYVEDRYRRPRGSGASLSSSFKLATVGIVVVLLASGLQMVETNARARAAHQQLADAVTGSNPCFGASALVQSSGACPAASANHLVPQPDIAKEDKSAAYQDGCWNSAPFDGMTTCTYGTGPLKIALVGNSHAGHWLPALEPLAAKNGWTITTYLASVCTATSAELAFDTADKAQGCTDWGKRVLDRTGGDQYDLIITSERNVLNAAGTTDETTYDAWKAGYRSYLESWALSGAKVLVIKDTPFPGNTIRSIPDCVSELGRDYANCAAERDDWIPAEPLGAAAEELSSSSISVADFNDFLCTDDRCSGVIGGVIAYFDGSHMTATFARSLAPFIEADILKSL